MDGKTGIMIDVEPFINKLDLLKQYVFNKIDSKDKVIIRWERPEPLQSDLSLFFQFGIILKRCTDVASIPVYEHQTFEQFLENRK